MSRLLPVLGLLVLIAPADVQGAAPVRPKTAPIAPPVPTKAMVEFQKLAKEFVGEYKDAKTADRNGVFDAWAPKFLKLAEDYKTDTAAPQILTFPLQMGAPHDAKATKLLKGIIDDNAGKPLGAAAIKIGLQFLDHTVKLAEQIRTNRQAKQAYIADRGKDAVKELLAKADKAPAEIKEYEKLWDAKFAKGHGFLLRIGREAPEVVCKDVNGKPARLSDLRGKVVVLDIWATWCRPCVQMIPHSRELVKKLEDKPFVLVSVSIDAKKQALLDFMKKEEMPWTHWWNGQNGPVVKDYQVMSIPSIWVLDHKGVIRFCNVRGEAMDKAVETLLAEMEKE
jgi:thiol-disulfide isomerase/thioredoxin